MSDQTLLHMFCFSADSPYHSHYADHVISGAGGRKLYSQKESNTANVENRGYKVRYFEKDFGVVGLEFDANQILATFYVAGLDDKLVETYNFVRPRSRNL